LKIPLTPFDKKGGRDKEEKNKKVL